MKYRMLIKMDSEVPIVAASLLLWVDLIVIHHNTSDTLRLDLYQIINGNWQNYEQGIMPQSHIIICSALFSQYLKSTGSGLC